MKKLFLISNLQHFFATLDETINLYFPSSAREQFASLLDRVTKNREVVIIQRRGGEDVAMIAADELASLTESAYLLRSPQNAERILSALARALKNEGKPQSIEELRRKVSMDDKKA